jgi:hypothetical protein
MTLRGRIAGLHKGHFVLEREGQDDLPCAVEPGIFTQEWLRDGAEVAISGDVYMFRVRSGSLVNEGEE